MVPLEAPRVRYVFTPQPSIPALSEQTAPVNVESVAMAAPVTNPASPFVDSFVDSAVIKLFDERLVIDRRKRKTGEVVVRKEIETVIVEVPVRREKLIVEQISPEYKQLAVVDLGQTQITERDMLVAASSPDVKAETSSSMSVGAAIQFLETIVAQSVVNGSNDSQSNDQQPPQVSLVFADTALQARYQQWLEQRSAAL